MNNFNKDNFKLLKEKLIEILLVLFNDEELDKLYICDEDFSRLVAPFTGSLLYLLLINRDFDKTIEMFLEEDNIIIIFFNISYLIIDNIMDSEHTSNDDKKIFLNWFNNGFEDLNNFTKINEIERNVWQINIFSKYFILFENKFRKEKYPDLYKFAKFMFNTLYKANKIQQNNQIDELVILEYTFKKSYVSILFLLLIINYKFSITITEDIFEKILHFILLIQLVDDYFDIDKDKKENNKTIFSSKNITNNFNKFITNNYKFYESLNINDKILKEIINNILIESSFILLLNNRELVDDEYINNFEKYSIFYRNSIEIFDKNMYNIFNEKLLIIFLKNKLQI